MALDTARAGGFKEAPGVRLMLREPGGVLGALGKGQAMGWLIAKGLG